MRTVPRSSNGSHPSSRGFTLIELLVVIFIILLISAVALPTVLPALSHRQVSEAGRILQGALVGARDKAIHDNKPSGIRLLPDPSFPIGRDPTGAIYPYSILAYNRVIPIESAPDYSEGNCTPYTMGNMNYLATLGVTITNAQNIQLIPSYQPCLILFESIANPKTGAPNPPTSWYWNIRVGDKIQLNNAGPWYTVVGPQIVMPSTTGGGNSEGFVNVGLPSATGQNSSLPVPSIGTQPLEFLVLVNGQDDNNNGWVDELFDGVDNNNDGIPDNTPEYELEQWLGSVVTSTEVNVPYTIRRRPAPTTNAREVALPTDIVIDATTLLAPSTVQHERSQFPVDPSTRVSGYIDILLNPDGTVLPVTAYSTPASFTMGSAFYHFWLAERQDLVAVTTTGTTETVTYGPNNTASLGTTAQTYAGGSAPYYLPIAQPNGNVTGSNYPGPYLKGEYAVLTLSARTGQIVVNSNPPFVNQAGNYYPFNPFLQAEQGVYGGP